MRGFSPHLLLLALINAAQLPAQPRADYEPRVCRGTHAATGGIRGVVIDDSTGAPVAMIAVRVDEVACLALSDSLGRFAFTNVAAGAHTVVAGSLWYRRLEPQRVAVMADSVVELALRLRLQNRVADCRAVPACAPLLDSDPRRLHGLNEEAQIRELLLRTTIVINGGHRGHWGVLCISDSSAVVIEAIRDRFSIAAPDASCETLPVRTEPSTVVHRETRAHGARVVVNRIRRSGDTVTANTHWYVGPLHATGWTCIIRKKDGIWAAESCRMDWIS